MALEYAPGVPKACPTCGGAMESGHVLGMPRIVPLYLGQLATTIGWLEGAPQGRGAQDQGRAEPLAKVGMVAFSRTPRFPAWRCAKCKRVEFSYENPVYRPGAGTGSPQPPT